MKVSLIERLGAPDDDPVVTEEKAAQGCGRCDAQYVTGVDMRFLARGTGNEGRSGVHSYSLRPVALCCTKSCNRSAAQS